MKAPDKIKIVKFRDTKELSDYWVLENKTQNESIEYIRKDTLLEWLEQNQTQAQMWFDRYNDREDLSAKQVWEKVIAKINEL